MDICFRRSIEVAVLLHSTSYENGIGYSCNWEDTSIVIKEEMARVMKHLKNIRSCDTVN